MSTRYASTQVGQYLLARFGFTFTDEEVFQSLEDHIWEAGRRAQVQRAHVHHVCKALAEDIGYVVKSVEKGDRSPYEPNQRGDFQGEVRKCIELEREVSDLIGAHQGVVKAVRLLLSNVPTLEEHTLALGRVRELEQFLTGKSQEVVELLAARDEWASDEAELLRRLDAAEAQSKDYASRLKATDQATNERIRDLERSLEVEKKAAEDFADERDDAQREATLAQDEARRWERERDELKEDNDELRRRVNALEAAAESYERDRSNEV